MESDRRSLRSVLAVSAPDLHAALLRSWEIAEAQWLPALGAALGSFNSYPHLRNVEHYLDALLTRPPEGGSPGEVRLRATLSPAELYVLLAATLLHDVGRTKGEPHGKHSGVLVEQDAAELGIPSRELAKSVARVAAYHDRLERYYAPEDVDPYPAPRPKHVVDPYGPVRERALASLLRLADYLDSTLTRVMPEYLRPMNQIEVVGAFRRVVTGVEIDHNAQMICTVLGDLPKEEPQEQDAFHFERHEDSPWPRWPRRRRTDTGSLEAAITKRYGTENVEHALLQELGDAQVPDAPWKEPGPSRPRLGNPAGGAASFPGIVPLVKEVIQQLDAGNGAEPCETFGPVDWLLARRVVKVEIERDATHGKEARWHPRHILAIVVSDVLKNARGLNSVRSDLAALGVPLRAWLLGNQQCLFNLWGEETFEPIFTLHYLNDVIEKMWALSVGVFGQSLFTYPTLADAIRDPDIARVRRAVRRIGVATRRCGQNGAPGAVWAGDNRWQWNCPTVDEACGTACCDPRFLEDVQEAVNSLGSPV